MDPLIPIPLVIIWGIFWSWVILGAGIRLPELRHWELRHMQTVRWRTRFREIIGGILFWPWFNIDRLWQKYDPNIK